jgi:hypothetical protein
VAALVTIAFGASAAWNIAQTAAATEGARFVWTSEVATIAVALALPVS